MSLANPYTVVHGDTGHSIANKGRLDFEKTLFLYNPGVKWTHLPVGYHLRTQPPQDNPLKYTIISGDSGIEIAGRLGITLQQLEELNPGIATRWTSIQPNQTLNVPNPLKVPNNFSGSTGTIILGVPALMPAPKEATAKRMPDDVRNKIKGFFEGDSAFNAAMDFVVALEWPGVFFQFMLSAHKLTPGQQLDHATARVMIIDLRDHNLKTDTDAVPWKIPAAHFLPCAEDKSNANLWSRTVTAAIGDANSPLHRMFLKEIKVVNNKAISPPSEVLFVDTTGTGRAPEIATRYARWLLDPVNGVLSKPIVQYMTGGMAAYCNAQCFGRIIQVSLNPYVTGWLPESK